MEYSSNYQGSLVRCGPQEGRKFQKSWMFDTDDLKAGSIALNVEATYIPKSERTKSLAIGHADMDYMLPDSTSEEIERKSARIQRELQRERRARSVSPRRGTAPATTSFPASAALPPRSARTAAPSTPRTSGVVVVPASHLEFPLDPMAADSLGVHIENADKMILGQELKTLRGALFTTKLHIRDAEKEGKLVRQKTEETRSELSLLEYKRSTANKDLHRLLDDLERKRAMSMTYDTEIEVKQKELRGFQSLGITPEEARTLQEENTDLRQRHRELEVIGREREELVRELASAKEHMTNEQHKGRRHREQLVEELETLKVRLDESQKGWALAQREVQALEDAFHRMERDKNELLQEQCKEYKAFKMMARQESQENRHLLSMEVDTLNKELQQLQVRVNDLQVDLKAKDEHNLKLRGQLTTLANELNEEQTAREAEREEHKQTLYTIRTETDAAMLKLKESLAQEKQRALQDLRAELDRDRSSRSEERMTQMLAENAQLLSEKNGEIKRLQEKMRDMQDSQRANEKRMQDKMDSQIREAVARERAAMEKETQWKLQSERENLARDTKQRVNEMQMTLDHERETSQRLTRELAQMREELEEQKRLTREAAKEKLVAVARAKDQIREQSNAELESVCQKIKQEMQLEVDRLHNQLRASEDEVRTLKADNQRLMGRERDNMTSLDHTEKTVITEINEENRRSAHLLGVSPRQVAISADSATSRAQINTALANLRAVNEELRKHIQELTSELDSCRAMITTMEKEKEESLENIRLEMEKKRTLELEKIKAKLIRERTDELDKVAQAGAPPNSTVDTLRRKDQENAQLRDSLVACRAESVLGKHARRLRNNETQQKMEKSRVPPPHSNKEQRRIKRTKRRGATRLEKKVYTSPLEHNSKKSLNNTHSTTPLQRQHHLNHQHHHQQQQEQHVHHQHFHQQQQQQQQDEEQQQQQQQQKQEQCLQARIEQLRYEKDALDHHHLSSENNLTVLDLPLMTSLPMSHILAIKMDRLENTLSEQNQELRRLEQAYDQLPAVPHVL